MAVPLKFISQMRVDLIVVTKSADEIF